jgi:hypothetical protein
MAYPGARQQPSAAYWFFDEKYGDQDATYIPVDPGQTADRWPSIPARLTCDVTYARRVWALFRRVPKNWVAPAGSHCQIVGRWTDGTVRLQVGLSDTRHPDRKQSIDGRFPAWVAEAVAQREILRSNVTLKRRSRLMPVLAIVASAVAVAACYIAYTRMLPLGSAAVETQQSAAPTAFAKTGTPPPASESRLLIPLPTVTVATIDIPRVHLVVANTDGQGVYLRRTPNMSDRLKAYPDGTKLNIVGSDVEAGGVHWRHVTAPDGTEGYVPADYVSEGD